MVAAAPPIMGGAAANYVILQRSVPVAFGSANP